MFSEAIKTPSNAAGKSYTFLCMFLFQISLCLKGFFLQQYTFALKSCWGDNGSLSALISFSANRLIRNEIDEQIIYTQTSASIQL